MPKQATGDVIVLLPGILGSELQDPSGAQLWSLRGAGMLRALFTIGSSLGRLRLPADDARAELAADGVRAVSLIHDLVLMPGLWRMDGYTALSKTLRQQLTVTPGENFFEFPYDWRRDNRAHARRLRAASEQWLHRWRTTSGNKDAKLILIGHSMGGLIARYFLEVEGGWTDARALITLGTPHRGAVEPLNRLVNGVDLGLGPLGPDLAALARSYPSCYQLVANWKAFDPGDGQWVRPFDAIHQLPGLDPELARDARSFHDELTEAAARNRRDPAWGTQGYHTYPIVGTRQRTLQSCSAHPGGIATSYLHRGQEVDGDGSVSQGSATPPEFPLAAQRMFSAATHGALQSSEAVLHQILGVIAQLDLHDQLASFPEPDSLIGLSLQAPDHLQPGEPLDVQVQPSERPEGPLTATLVDALTGRTVATQSRAATDDGPLQFTFPPPGEGVYRLTVRGAPDAWVQPISDGLVALAGDQPASHRPQPATGPRDRHADTAATADRATAPPSANLDAPAPPDRAADPRSARLDSAAPADRATTPAPAHLHTAPPADRATAPQADPPDTAAPPSIANKPTDKPDPRPPEHAHSATEPAPTSLTLELFLADEQGTPALEGLPRAAVAYSEGAAEQPESFTNPGASPNDLAEQGWAVIVPLVGAEQRLEAIRPLIDKRARDQGGPVQVLRAPPDLDPLQTLAWVSAELARPGVDLRAVPLYLLLLGSPAELSLAMQQTLSSGSLVGRLDLDRLDDYAAYAAKVVQHEAGEGRPAAPRALFLSVLDGTRATAVGHEGLIAPTLADLQRHEHRYGAASVEALHVPPGQPDAAAFLTSAADPTPTVLFSMSHGTGPTRNGWRSADHQRALQGSLSLGQGRQLTAEHLGSGPFLPGGLWFCFACYGAGTPRKSSYYHWLRRLSSERRYSGDVQGVLAGLPQGDGQGFVAALPKAALANPQGPVAVVGHLDLAWTYAFQDLDRAGVSRHKRFLDTLRQMYGGDRVGVAMSPLFAARENLERWAASAQDLVEAGELTREALLDGHRWMTRQDLDGYVILGDPAARLPSTGATATATATAPQHHAPSTTIDPLAAPPTAGLERAIWELIEGHDAPRAIAARNGLTHHELLATFARYVNAGRTVIG